MSLRDEADSAILARIERVRRIQHVKGAAAPSAITDERISAAIG